MSARSLSMWAAAALCAVACQVFVGSASAGELPDGRGYEQVSPENKLGTEVYQPRVSSSYIGGGIEANRPLESNTETEFTFQAAADGGGLAFVEGPTVGGSEIEGKYGGNEYLAKRSADGVWSQTLLTPGNAPSTIFEAFTPNLATAFVSSLQPLSPSAPGYGENTEFGARSDDTLYTVSTAGGDYIPAFSTKAPFRNVEEFGTVHGTAKAPGTGFSGCGYSACLDLEGVSADHTHLLFAADDALTGASEGRPAAEGGTNSEFEKENNLYESVSGQLRLVNVLPNGTTHANAAFGGVEKYGYNERRPIFSHAISDDGSRIFWTDLSTGHLYMRENGTKTVEISPAGTYETAAPDGSTVFYTNGDLYAYDVENGRTTDLTPGVTVVQVVGSSENDEYIYYVNGEDELALWHDGVSTQITTTPLRVFPTPQITAEVTPSGQSLVFRRQDQ